MLMEDKSWAGAGSAIASILFLFSVLRQYIPFHLLEYYFTTVIQFLYPYVKVKIPEYSGGRMKRSEAYAAIEAYLSATCSKRAKKLKAELGKGCTNLMLSMDDFEEVTDEFCGAKLWWSASMTTSNARPMLPWYNQQEERRFYTLTFHRRHRDLIVNSYLSHVMKEGREVGIRNRHRKLYTNNTSSYKLWSHVVFEHPATFDTVAMDPKKKKEIIDDLMAFKKGKDYYAKIGKAWKRGYLLYGPPGTGKSSMIAAIANLLDYDIYDLELTSVKSNLDLRKLFIETTSKSIIVIEDIDCSLDLTGKRKAKKSKKNDSEEGGEVKGPPKKKEKTKKNNVTLSGLLNFIDGLWSACGGERIIIFTTNHLEKLDPALIRRGRMDKRIEMSYCCFEAFKVLAMNYLSVQKHGLFETVRALLDEVQMTPADVAENLMPKSMDEDADACIGRLVRALELAKEAAALGVNGEAVEDVSEDDREPSDSESDSDDDDE